MATVSSDRRFGIDSGTAVKVPCKAATTANVTLSGQQTVDGTALVAGDRVLVKDQTTASENGIYVVDTSAWDRAKDWDGVRDVKKGTFVYVHSGSTNTGFWYVSTSDTITPGTTSVTIARAASVLAAVSVFAQSLLDDADAAAVLTTLGVSAFAQTLLDDANSAGVLTTLGVSAFAQTLLDDASAATARATLEAAGLTDNNDLSGDNDIKDTLEIYDPVDTTKKVRFDAGSVSTGTTRVVTVPDRDITIGDAIVSGTPIATTSGTSHDFTGIPSWVKNITIMFAGVSTNGASVPLIQIGDSGGIETTGYLGSGSAMTAAVGATAYTTGFGLENSGNAAFVRHGTVVLSLLDSSTNTWAAHGVLGQSDSARVGLTAGTKSLSATLDRVRLTTVNGTDTFDAGSINILYK